MKEKSFRHLPKSASTLPHLLKLLDLENPVHLPWVASCLIEQLKIGLLETQGKQTRLESLHVTWLGILRLKDVWSPLPLIRETPTTARQDSHLVKELPMMVGLVEIPDVRRSELEAATIRV